MANEKQLSEKEAAQRREIIAAALFAVAWAKSDLQDRDLAWGAIRGADALIVALDERAAEDGAR